MFYEINKLLKSIWRRDEMEPRRRNEKIYPSKGSIIICFLFLLSACQSDISITEQRETSVVVDSFTQSEKLGELDVLISLDTSGSMHDNYDDVSNGMEILRTDIENLTLDYQFGYITMDPTNLSYIGPYDSSSSTIDMLMAPNLLASAGLEEGFAATYRFLTSEEGLGFKRPEADFLLFLISDEEEQSSIPAGVFYDWLNDEFADIRHDVVSITQLEDSECGYPYDVGYKYEEIANFYGKDAIDICEEDWSVWLSNSSYLIERRDSITLSNSSPIVDSIVVYIDQVEIRDWSYDDKTRTVHLDHAPGYGQLVEVGYKVYI